MHYPGHGRIRFHTMAMQNDSTVQGYLDSMVVLESDYPDLTFIYQTGPISKNGLPITAEIYVLNDKIRNFCRTNNKVLFDFADIESYDPDGNYYLDQYATEDCYYDKSGDDFINKIEGDGNWADEWCEANPGECFYEDNCLHSRPLNCQMKGVAFWWMFARLAGWKSNGSVPTTIKNSSSSQIKLYPNPSKGANEIKVEGINLLEASNIELYNTSGSLIQTLALSENNSFHIPVLEEGIYLVQISSIHQRNLVKLIIK
jgi:hypothetical protein